MDNGLVTLLSNKSMRKSLEQPCSEIIKTNSATIQQLFAEFKQPQRKLGEL